jgi:hypothetical protein
VAQATEGNKPWRATLGKATNSLIIILLMKHF